MLTDPWFYVAALPAMFILGISKGGLGTIGMLAVPIFSFVMSPVQAAGITLPILVVSDLIAVFNYRRKLDTNLIWILLPGALVGVVIGWLTAAWVTEHWIRLIVGLVSIFFALNYWFRHKKRIAPAERSIPKGIFWGTITGFVSFVSHSGGPPYQIYAAPLRLDPQVFAGTSVIFFAIVNAVKLIPYFFLGQFDSENILASLAITPLAIVAVFFGVWLTRRIDPARYYDLIHLLIFLVGIFLAWQGLAELV